MLAPKPVVMSLLQRLAFFVMAALFVPVGLVVFFASLLLIGAITAMLGPAAKDAWPVTLVAWLAITAGALFLIFRAMYRRLPTRAKQLLVPEDATDVPLQDAGSARPATTRSGEPGVTKVGRIPSLAELDARLAPEYRRPARRRRTSPGSKPR